MSRPWVSFINTDTFANYNQSLIQDIQVDEKPQECNASRMQSNYTVSYAFSKYNFN